MQKLSPLGTIYHANSSLTIHTVKNQNSTLPLCNENWLLSSHIVLPNAEDGRQHRLRTNHKPRYQLPCISQGKMLCGCQLNQLLAESEMPFGILLLFVRNWS